MITGRANSEKKDPSGPTHADAGRLPDFVIIGAMKSGTTTLHRHLRRHPSVHMSRPKEPQFFSREEKYALGEAWYRSLFAGATEGQVCGEASTCYSRWPHFGDVPGRIARHMPEVKLIYLMRHPVERAYSHYQHLMRLCEPGGEALPFESALEHDPEILDASLYTRQIERFLEHFDRDRLLLLTIDDLTSDPRGVLESVQRFIGIEVVDHVAEDALRANAAEQDLVYKRANRWVRRLRNTPLLAPLRRVVPESTRGALVARLRRAARSPILHRDAIRRYHHDHSLAPEARRRLLDRFAEPTRELERFWGRELPAWFR